MPAHPDEQEGSAWEAGYAQDRMSERDSFETAMEEFR